MGKYKGYRGSTKPLPSSPACQTAETPTQPFEQKLVLNVQVRGPGRMRVLINGKDISRQIDDWMLTETTFISFWGYKSSGFTLPLDPALAFDPAGLTTPPGSPVTVTIIPRDFQGPDWRISVEVEPFPQNIG